VIVLLEPRRLRELAGEESELKRHACDDAVPVLRRLLHHTDRPLVHDVQDELEAVAESMVDQEIRFRIGAVGADGESPCTDLPQAFQVLHHLDAFSRLKVGETRRVELVIVNAVSPQPLEARLARSKHILLRVIDRGVPVITDPVADLCRDDDVVPVAEYLSDQLL